MIGLAAPQKEPSMRVQNLKKFRRLVAGRCRFCDRRFFYRHPGRPRSYCDHKCQQAEFRHSRYLHPKRDENPLKSPTNSNISKVDFGDRPLPLNLVGGHRWSMAIAVDRETLAEIISTEIGGFKSGEANSESPNPYLAEITADLSIPAFLGRRS
jgi:hypothetical protein